jgi:hypothetical protein
MRKQRKLLAVAGGFLLALVTTMAVGAPGASASVGICGNDGSGYCLNDWNGGGLGNAIKMYYGNSSNEDFYVELIDRCNGNYLVTATCPSTDYSFDKSNEGSDVVQIVYGPNNDCVADPTGSGDGVLGKCNYTSTGSGGAQGSVFIIDKSNDLVLYNNYWTNYDDSPNCMTSGGNPGQPLILFEFNQSLCTQWYY